MNRLKFRIWDYEIKSFVGKDLEINECNFAYGVTFQQFTGVKDLEGKDIYEGDIISCEEFLGETFRNKKHKLGVVIYKNAAFWYSIDSLRNYSNPHILLMHASKAKILGNIFENPELLK